MDEVMGTGNDVKREKGREAPSGGRVTIRELAEAAGVSTATVSNVIHGKTKRVSPETIRRVQELIQTMGYVRGGSGRRKGLAAPGWWHCWPIPIRRTRRPLAPILFTGR